MLLIFSRRIEEIRHAKTQLEKQRAETIAKLHEVGTCVNERIENVQTYRKID